MGNLGKMVLPSLLVVLLLMGCSSSDPQVIDESKYEDLYDHQRESDDGVDSDEVDESDGDEVELDDEDIPDPPELPDAVKDPSEDGAVAAAEYFLDAYEYAYRTTDSSALLDISSDDCDVCVELIERFDGFDQSMIAQDAAFIDRNVIGVLSNADGTYVSVEMHAIDFHIKGSDGAVRDKFDPVDYTFIFLMNLEESTWVVAGADFRKSADLD